MKKIAPQVETNLDLMKGRAQTLRDAIQANEIDMLNIVLAEARRLAIPVHWPFDFDTNMFHDPKQIPEGKMIVEAGPSKTLILAPKQQILT